jgi:hypothetical protein
VRCGNVARRKSSEFGVPRGSTAWRPRGPPTAVTEPRTQYQAIHSQPHSCSALWGHFFEPSRSVTLLAIARLSLHRVTCYCVSYLIYSQEPVPRTGWLVTVIGAYNDIQYAGPRLPLCTIVFSYGCLICQSVARCKRRTRTNKSDGRSHSSPHMSRLVEPKTQTGRTPEPPWPLD